MIPLAEWTFLAPIIPLMKDFVLNVGNLGGGKTLAMTGLALSFAEDTAKGIAELKRRVEIGEITQAEMDEAVKHARESFLNYQLKMDVLRADCEAEAKRLESLEDKWGAMAARDIPNHIHYVENVYGFIIQRRRETETNPLPDQDEGRDYLGIDEAQDLIRSRRSGDKYVKILSENADFFRKMGLEVMYQGPQQSQMDKNFRGKSTKKVLSEKFEYKDPGTGWYEDPATHINYYFIKYTVFDTSQTEKRKSAIFFMPYDQAIIVHKYYGTNVFHSQSLTSKTTMQDFLEENPEAQGSLDDEDGEKISSDKEFLIALAEQQATIAKELARNPFFTAPPKENKKIWKWLAAQAGV